MLSEDEKRMLELEIHGLDIELDVRRHRHYYEVIEIERLERARANLVARLNGQQNIFED